MLDIGLNMSHNFGMRRVLSNSQINKWAESVGGVREATLLVMSALKCSASKAQKIASGRYPSLPQPLEQDALVALLQLSRETLFPMSSSKGKAKAS